MYIKYIYLIDVRREKLYDRAQFSVRAENSLLSKRASFFFSKISPFIQHFCAFQQKVVCLGRQKLKQCSAKVPLLYLNFIIISCQLFYISYYYHSYYSLNRGVCGEKQFRDNINKFGVGELFRKFFHHCMEK